MQTAHRHNRSSGVIELVAGHFAPAVSLIWSGQRAAEYLAAPDARRHVWHACLASDQCTFSVEREGADFLYARMSAMKARDLILQAYGVRPSGILGVLSKLGPQPRPVDIYQLLMMTMEKGGFGAKLLMHTEKPADALIETLAMLPEDMSKVAIAALAAPNAIAPENLALFVWTVSRLCSIDRNLDYSALLQADDPIKALLTWLTDRQFPAPPWPGNERLRPINSCADLLRAGRDFKNCLRSFRKSEAMKVLNGSKYYYEWTGNDPALLDLVRLADVGWYVNEVRGRNNEDVSVSTRRAIFEALSDAPDICAVRLTIRDNIYPCSRFWGEVFNGIG